MLYNEQKKSSATAAFLSFLVPSSGHAYAGNWGRGLLIGGGKILLSYLTARALWNNGDDALVVMSYIGVYVVGTIYEMYDSANHVKKHNHKLYQEIYAEQIKLGIGLTPNLDGGRLMLTYHF